MVALSYTSDALGDRSRSAHSSWKTSRTADSEGSEKARVAIWRAFCSSFSVSVMTVGFGWSDWNSARLDSVTDAVIR